MRNYFKMAINHIKIHINISALSDSTVSESPRLSKLFLLAFLFFFLINLEYVYSYSVGCIRETSFTVLSTAS